MISVLRHLSKCEGANWKMDMNCMRLVARFRSI